MPNRTQAPRVSSCSRVVLIILLLAASIVCVYIQTVSFSFVGFDDPELVVQNPHVNSGLTKENLKWAFAESWQKNVFFYPLSLVSHMADCELFGLQPGMHHLSSVIYHMAAVMLLFVLLLRTTGEVWRPAAVCALFAIHPLNADSVAWVAERSNLVCAIFWMATLVAYLSYCRNKTGKKKRYLACLFFFIPALLAKPTAVTLPVVMLLFDWLVLQRPGQQRPGLPRPMPGTVLAEKLPFFLLAGATAATGILVPAATGATIPTANVPLYLRAANSLVSYVTYIRRLFLPYDLSVYYPFPHTIPVWKPLAAATLLLIVTGAAFHYRKRRPMVLFGWLWYLVTLLPATGLVQSGPWPAMADHFVYLPMIGLLAAIAWAIPKIPENKALRRTGCLTILVIITVMGVWGHRQAGYYRNSITLFSRAVALDPGNFFALTGLGNAYQQAGEMQKAETFFRQALRLRPDSAGAHNNLGLALAARGKTGEAMGHFMRAVEIAPTFAQARVNIGNLLLKKGAVKQAAFQYKLALRYDPGLVSAANNLALALAASGHTDEAIGFLEKALEKNPRNPALRRTLEKLLMQNKNKKK